MNYAEDRLDRRSNDRGGRDGLRRDLERARALLLRGHADAAANGDDEDEDDATGGTSPSTSTAGGGGFIVAPSSRADAPARVSSGGEEGEVTAAAAGEDAGMTTVARRRRLLRREGHSLAGRTLRDSGRCRQACYHFARAWIECPEDAMAAGDYAQMADLAGFPEVGVVALLFHRSGGTPRDVDLEGWGASSPPGLVGLDGDDDGGDEDEEGEGEACHTGGGRCGCPPGEAGGDVASLGPCRPRRLPPCHAPFDADDARPVLEALGGYCGDGGRRRAVDGGGDDSGVLSHLIWHFWEEPDDCGARGCDCGDACGDGGDRGAGPGRSSALPPSDDSPADAVGGARSGARHLSPRSARSLPPVVQLLLLKLLYSSPAGGPFLRLACRAVVRMSRGTAFGTGTALASRMAREYKSHWAYFVLARSLVIGERVKPHRRNRRGGVPYHVPVGDVVRGVDERRCVSGVNCGDDCSSAGPVAEGSSGGGRDVGDGAMSTPKQGAECGDGFDRFSHFLSTLLRECSSLSERGALCTHDPPSLCSIRYQPRIVSKSAHHPLFFVGDSHVLSAAWQSIHVATTPPGRTVHSRTVVPVLVTGLKAWHCRPQTPFFTYRNLIAALDRLPPTARTIVLSAGEIDVREGIGGRLLENYYDDCRHAVQNTTREYVRALSALLLRPPLPDGGEDSGRQRQRGGLRHGMRQILVAPVAPHAYRSEKNGKAVGRAKRRERTVLWNDMLRIECAKRNAEGIYFLDYEVGLRSDDPNSPVGFVLDRAYNADYTHLNSAFLPLLESAVTACGCDLDLI